MSPSNTTIEAAFRMLWEARDHLEALPPEETAMLRERIDLLFCTPALADGHLGFPSWAARLFGNPAKGTHCPPARGSNDDAADE